MHVYILWKKSHGEVSSGPPEMVSVHISESSAVEDVPKEYHEYERTPFKKGVVKDYTYMFVSKEDLKL